MPHGHHISSPACADCSVKVPLPWFSKYVLPNRTLFACVSSADAITLPPPTLEPSGVLNFEVGLKLCASSFLGSIHMSECMSTTYRSGNSSPLASKKRAPMPPQLVRFNASLVMSLNLPPPSFR